MMDVNTIEPTDAVTPLAFELDRSRWERSGMFVGSSGATCTVTQFVLAQAALRHADDNTRLGYRTIFAPGVPRGQTIAEELLERAAALDYANPGELGWMTDVLSRVAAPRADTGIWDFNDYAGRIFWYTDDGAACEMLMDSREQMIADEFSSVGVSVSFAGEYRHQGGFVCQEDGFCCTD